VLRFRDDPMRDTVCSPKSNLHHVVSTSAAQARALLPEQLETPIVAALSFCMHPVMHAVGRKAQENIRWHALCQPVRKKSCVSTCDMCSHHVSAQKPRLPLSHMHGTNLERFAAQVPTQLPPHGQVPVYYVCTASGVAFSGCCCTCCAAA
jgi:hypothetical protein